MKQGPSLTPTTNGSTENSPIGTPSSQDTLANLVLGTVEGELHNLTNIITLVFKVIEDEVDCKTEYSTRFVDQINNIFWIPSIISGFCIHAIYLYMLAGP